MAIQHFFVNTEDGGGARERRATQGRTLRRSTIAALVLLVAASCGSGSDGSAEDPSTPDEVEAVIAAEPEATGEPAPEPTASEPDTDGRRAISYPALGGFSVEVDSDVLVSSGGDYMTLRRADSQAFVVFARTSQAAGGEESVLIETVDEFLMAAQAYSQGEVTATDETIEVFGAELTLHEFRGGLLPPGPGLFATGAAEFGSNVWWTPGPVADVYLGEIEGGVLAIAAVAPTDEALGEAKSLVADLVPTLSLTTSSGAVSELPSRDDYVEAIGEPLDFRPATLDPDGPPEFTALFAPVAPGAYQIGNLSVPIAIDFGADWFAALNFPTYVVLLEPPLVGPGFRDIIFQQGVNAISGVSLGPTKNGEPTPIDDISDFLADPPAQLMISNVDREANIGGLDAVRFDVRIGPNSSCQPGDPCEFVLTSAVLQFAAVINPGVVHRVWWIDDVPAGPLVITAHAAEADADWLDTRAEELLATLVIGSSE